MPDKPKLAVVLSLNRPSLMDIPHGLRELAQDIEDRKGEIQAVVAVCRAADGTISVFGYGGVGSTLETVGTLSYAKYLMMESTGVPRH